MVRVKRYWCVYDWWLVDCIDWYVGWGWGWWNWLWWIYVDKWSRINDVFFECVDENLFYVSFLEWKEFYLYMKFFWNCRWVWNNNVSSEYFYNFFIWYLISFNLGFDEWWLEEEFKNVFFEKKNCFLRDMFDKEFENNKFY